MVAPALEPGRGGLGALGAGAGEQRLGAGRGEDLQPGGVVRGGVGGGRVGQQVQQAGPDGGVGLAQLDQRAVPGLPEGRGCPVDRRGVQELGEQRPFVLGAVQPGGPDQRAGVLGDPGVRGHAGRGALGAQLAEALPGGQRVEPLGELLDVLAQGLDGERAGQGELQEDGAQPLLVHRQAVGALGLAGLAEPGGGVGLVAVAEEDPADLLAEGGQEVRDGAAEPGGELVEAVLGGAGLGGGLAGQPLHLLDQGERVVAVGRVVDQCPGREAQRLLADLADLGGLAVGRQAEELDGEVLGPPERTGDQPDDPAAVERGVGVAAGGEHVGGAVGAAGPGQGAGRQYGAGVEQGLRQSFVRCGGGVRAGGGVRTGGGGGGGGHAASSPSSVRPAYRAAAIRMPSDQATGPTSVSGRARPSGPAQLSAPVSHASYS